MTAAKMDLFHKSNNTYSSATFYDIQTGTDLYTRSISNGAYERPTIEGGEQFVRMTALGGFRQVGRSATLLMTKESKILIDCGLDPSSDATPYFGVPEIQPLSDIDAIVITHAHMDHCGLLPALFKYGYDGPVYCTPPTRDLMALLQLDSIKLIYGEGKKRRTRPVLLRWSRNGKGSSLSSRRIMTITSTNTSWAT